MNMKEFLKSSTQEERENLANKAGTTVSYFWQIAGGHRKPGAMFCKDIEKISSGKIKAEELRPDYFK
jgi:DNA-binding transcriptional regulator YdaS (Cro superfamily)